MAKLMGIVDIVVDGNTLLSGDSATLDPGGTNRSPVVGSSVHGYREEVRPSSLECEISIDANFSIDDYRDITDATCSFVADTGQVWSIQGAWQAEPPQISQKDGKAKLKFQGPPAEETL